MFDRDVTFFDIDVGRAVFAHRAQLDQVTVRQKFAKREQHVQRADDVIHLRENCVLPIDHRIGSRALLREVHHCFRLERFERGSQKIVVGDVANENLDGLARQVLPHADAIGQRTNRSERLCAEFVIPQAAQEIINDGNRMALL